MNFVYSTLQGFTIGVAVHIQNLMVHGDLVP